MPELIQFDSGKSMMRNLPPNWHRRLGAPQRQVLESRAAPACENERQRYRG